MDNRIADLENFFKRYANNFNNALINGKVDVKTTAASFAKCFVEASPAGINCAKNGWLFRWMIPRGYAHYSKIGIQAMVIRSVETQLLDELHSLNKVHWRSEYQRKDGVKGAIDFTVMYLVQTKEQEHKIFAYITGDEAGAMKKAGLM